MPRIDEGPLSGFYAPDYAGGSIVNLMSSLIRARGGHSPHDELTVAPAKHFANAHRIMYLVLDGLGLHQLKRHLASNQGQRFFGRHGFESITTVFPATTAAAVTTFDTGASPAEHGILSWYLHLPDLGCIATVLRSATRLGTPLGPADFDLAAYYNVPSHVATTTCHLGLLSWGDIVSLPFATVGTRWPDARSYQDLAGLRATLASFAHEDTPGLAYAYWPRYDGLCHEYGCRSQEVETHFDALDQTLADLLTDIRGSRATLCVLADHGLIDVPRTRCIDLAEVPGLLNCLATAPAGDQRQMSLFVRPHALDAFHRIVARELDQACVCLEGRTLLEAGVFGPGQAHPSLTQRVGDYVLLSRPEYAMIYTPPGTKPLYMPGSHGGMSAEEIQIPLYVVHANA